VCRTRLSASMRSRLLLLCLSLLLHASPRLTPSWEYHQGAPLLETHWQSMELSVLTFRELQSCMYEVRLDTSGSCCLSLQSLVP